jgi:enoyl-CoA hydratase
MMTERIGEWIRYETPADQIARVVMDRPDARNAQDLQMTYDLNEAFDRAVADDDIKVIILAGEDPHFSSGHDLSGDTSKTWRDFPVVSTWAGFDLPGAEGRFGREHEIYLDITERWRNLSKPMIAEVQGKCIAGGLMLAWACDLIVASDDAAFRDPVLEMGVCGVEFFSHPWEIGPRKAKEWLMTADWLTAEQALALGMLNHVVPRAELGDFTLDLAKRIANKPAFALKMTKEAVNQTMDAMGRKNAMQQVFSLHQLCHSHNQQVFNMAVDPTGFPEAVRKSLERKAAEAKDA